jgi:hypothetical protein
VNETPPPARPAGASRRDAVDLELRRVTSRLAALGPARLTRPGQGGVTPVERVRAVLQHLADVAAAAEGRPHRAVPELASHALGDQLAVLVEDVLAAVGGSVHDMGITGDVHDRLVLLRRSL